MLRTGATATVATVSPATLRRLELAAGELASTCLAAMDRQPWFGRLTADQRAAVLLVTQRGVVDFVAWLGDPAEPSGSPPRRSAIAPRDLARRLSLRQTVELVRIATDVFEERLPPLAADEDERRCSWRACCGSAGRRLRRRHRLRRRGRGPRRVGRPAGGAGRRRGGARAADGGGDDVLVSRAAGAGLGTGGAGAVRRRPSPGGDPPQRLADLRGTAP